jgi:histidyl-tRNA synthetase
MSAAAVSTSGGNMFRSAITTRIRSSPSENPHAGYRVDVYPEPDKLGKQFKYAAGVGIPRVAVLGSDERTRGVVTIKDMKSGEQTQVPREALPPGAGSEKTNK